jgi:excisionase family DNA binding protein
MSEKSTDVGSRLIGYREAAERLGLSEFTVRRYVSERRVPYVKIGAAVRFDTTALEQWIDKHRIEPSGGRR